MAAAGASNLLEEQETWCAELLGGLGCRADSMGS